MLFPEVIILYKLVLFQFCPIFPFWFIGVFVGSIVSVFFSTKITDLASRMNYKKMSFCMIILAALLGAASPICMYGTIPFIAALGKKGIPGYLLAAFMITSILINPNLLVFSVVLGLHVAILRLLCCLATGIIVGLLVKIFFKMETLETSSLSL
jgi:uncharacterized membrane protein YraQ (UPF0718 family)